MSDAACRARVVPLVAAVLLGAHAAQPAAAQVPIPQGLTSAPDFTGAPATPRPVPAPPAPQHPFMAPNGSSNLHEDAWQTDASARAGPLGRDVLRTSTFLARICGSLTFDSAGRILTVCVGLEHPRLLLLEPRTLRTIAAYDLPPRDPRSGNPFTDFAGGGYFYLDQRDRAVIPTTSRHIVVVAVEGDSLRPVADYDLTALVPDGDAVISALPDWAGRLWFASRQGVLGTVDTAGGGAHRAVRLEPIGNSFAVGEEGEVYVVTDGALYRFTAGADGAPVQQWRRPYANSGVRKPGQTQAGSGTTPTITARGLVAITDNADPMNVVVFRRADGAEVCRVPVFERGAGSTDQSLIAAGRSLVAENNYGYTGPQATEGGRTTTPGLERVVVSKDLRTCRSVWRSQEVAPSVVPKLSLANGLVYTYTKPAADTDDWYLTAIDFRSGATVFKARAGEGLGHNNHYAPVTIGPDGTAYVGALGGLVALRDAVAPPQPTGRPQPRLRLVVRCRRGRRTARVAGPDTDWIRRLSIRVRGRRARARVTLTDGRTITLRARARRPCSRVSGPGSG